MDKLVRTQDVLDKLDSLIADINAAAGPTDCLVNSNAEALRRAVEGILTLVPGVYREGTAAEMFRALGFRRIGNTGCLADTIFRTKRDGRILEIRVYSTGDNIRVNAYHDGFKCGLTGDEILAAAQLVREIGGEAKK